jgi:hypothetical protein
MCPGSLRPSSAPGLPQVQSETPLFPSRCTAKPNHVQVRQATLASKDKYRIYCSTLSSVARDRFGLRLPPPPAPLRPYSRTSICITGSAAPSRRQDLDQLHPSSQPSASACTGIPASTRSPPPLFLQPSTTFGPSLCPDPPAQYCLQPVPAPRSTSPAQIPLHQLGPAQVSPSYPMQPGLPLAQASIMATAPLPTSISLSSLRPLPTSLRLTCSRPSQPSRPPPPPVSAPQVPP